MELRILTLGCLFSCFWTGALSAQEFSAAQGTRGAGLSTENTVFRASADVGLHTQNTDRLGGSTSTGLGWTFDLGIKLSDEVELEAQLPVSQLFVSSPSGLSDQGTIGNLSLGANWFGKKESLLFKVGAALAFGPWNDDASALEIAALATALAMHGTEDIQLWTPGHLALSVPARIELGDVIRFTGDGQLTLMAPTAGGDAEASLLLAPGLSLALAKTIYAGVRLPVHLLPTNEGDAAQVFVEPFARVDLGPLMLSTRLTMNLDEPLGFAFDSGKYWGLHLGAGLSF